MSSELSEAKKEIRQELYSWWHTPISLRQILKVFFNDFGNMAFIVILQNLVLLSCELLCILMISYVAGNQAIPHEMRVVLASFVIIIAFLPAHLADGIRGLVQSYYHVDNMAINMFVLLILAFIVSFVIAQGDIKWMNILICILAILGALWYVVKAVIRLKHNK